MAIDVIFFILVFFKVNLCKSTQYFLISNHKVEKLTVHSLHNLYRIGLLLAPQGIIATQLLKVLGMIT